ncbi:MAG: HAD-IA family hydrolase [Candidatus Saccharibacteria bacterium]
MAVKAVIFDCFGVLITIGRDLLHQTYPQFSDQLTELERKSDSGLVSRSEFYNSVVAITGISMDDAMNKYYSVENYNQSSIDLIKQIKATGRYKIGLLSNIGHGWLDDFLPIMNGMNLFDTVILSSDIGITKPDPKIFELMAEKLGVNNDECIMIDDTPVNIASAINTGMQGIIFDSIDQAKNDLGKLIEIA